MLIFWNNKSSILAQSRDRYTRSNFLEMISSQITGAMWQYQDAPRMHLGRPHVHPQDVPRTPPGHCQDAPRQDQKVLPGKFLGCPQKLPGQLQAGGWCKYKGFIIFAVWNFFASEYTQNIDPHNPPLGDVTDMRVSWTHPCQTLQI